MKEQAETQLDRLVEMLRLHAADFKQQVQVLPSSVDIPDELALTYHDCHLFVPQLVAARLLQQDVVPSLEAIDATLEAQSGEGNAAFWTLEALQDDEQWEHVRSLAAEVLDKLGYPKRRPRLEWITYVKDDSKGLPLMNGHDDSA